MWISVPAFVRSKARIEKLLDGDLRQRFENLSFRKELPTSLQDLRSLEGEEKHLQKMSTIRSLKKKLTKNLPSCLTWEVVERVLCKVTPATIEEIAADPGSVLYVLDETAKTFELAEPRVSLAKFQAELESHALILQVDLEEAS